MADVTISGLTQSYRFTLSGRIYTPLEATVDGDTATVIIVGRRSFIGGTETVIELVWNTLNAGTYAYVVWTDVPSYTELLTGNIIISTPQAITEIKTINSESLLGSGNIDVGGGTFSGTMDDIDDGITYVKTENNFTDALLSKLNLIGRYAEFTATAGQTIFVVVNDAIYDEPLTLTTLYAVFIDGTEHYDISRTEQQVTTSPCLEHQKVRIYAIR